MRETAFKQEADVSTCLHVHYCVCVGTLPKLDQYAVPGVCMFAFSGSYSKCLPSEVLLK